MQDSTTAQDGRWDRGSVNGLAVGTHAPVESILICVGTGIDGVAVFVLEAVRYLVLIATQSVVDHHRAACDVTWNV